MNIEICVNKESMEDKSTKSKTVLHSVRFYAVIFVIMFMCALVCFNELSKAIVDSILFVYDQAPFLLALFFFMLVLFGKRFILMSSIKSDARTKKSTDKLFGFEPMPHQLN
jgi:hypothetical protein